MPSLSRPLLARLRKSTSQSQAVREEVEYELPNATKGWATVAAVPFVEDGTATGSLILFDDVTRLRAASAELAQIKAKANGRKQAN